MAVLLLDLDVGGRVYRVASERCVVTDQLGRSLVYEAGLGDLEVGATRVLGARRVPIEVSIPVDWSLVESRGARLDGRPAVLRLWRGTETLERSAAIARGLTDGVRIEDGGALLRFEIADDVEARALTLPAPSANVGTETWPVRATFEVPDSQIGKLYPVLIGYPGDHPGGVHLAEPAFPAPRVEFKAGAGSSERMVFGVGRIEAAQGTLWFEVDGELDPFDDVLAVTQDLLGQTVTYYQVITLGTTDDTEFWGGLKKASGWGGGILSPYTGEVLRGAGEVSRYILDYYAPTLVIDEGRMVGAQAWLDRFQVDGVLLGVNAVRWLSDSVLAFLSVVGVDGPRGFYLAPLRWTATATDAVAYLDADTGQIALDGSIEQWGEEVRNLLTLRYRPRRMGAEYASARTLAGDRLDFWAAAVAGGAIVPPQSSQIPWIASSIEDERTWGSGLCRASQARYGVREYTADHPACWDDATAALILHDWADRWATPKRLARYVSTDDDLLDLLPGDVVVINDSANRLSAQVALVLERTVSVASVALDLVLLGAADRHAS